jgi:S1-C subfamily serine protease
MSQSLYPVSHPPPQFRESHLTKVLAVLLLVVAVALVYTVLQFRRQSPQQNISFEPRPIAQRPDDKLGADEKATIDVFKKFSRSVVHITSLDARRDRMTLDVSEIPQGTGTGFVWDSNGHVVTNFHVIQHGNRASVTLQDGSSYPATIVGQAPDKDLAVLKIDAPAQKLQPLPVGTSASLEVGQKVLAIGSSRSRSARSTTSSRPMRRSTRATPVVRCSTARAG